MLWIRPKHFAEQNRTEQNRTEQNRTGQDRTEQCVNKEWSKGLFWEILEIAKDRNSSLQSDENVYHCRVWSGCQRNHIIVLIGDLWRIQVAPAPEFHDFPRKFTGIKNLKIFYSACGENFNSRAQNLASGFRNWWIYLHLILHVGVCSFRQKDLQFINKAVAVRKNHKHVPRYQQNLFNRDLTTVSERIFSASIRREWKYTVTLLHSARRCISPGASIFIMSSTQDTFARKLDILCMTESRSPHPATGEPHHL